MMQAREDRIRTFMQLELEACLEEVSWSIRCYNCEILGCPQEEYPARLLPTLPPNYEDNIQSRLIMAQKGIFPASLKMILKSEHQLPVLRPVPEISVQPDSVIGEHRAGENSTSSECDPSPRRAAVVTRSEEFGTPPHSPAIITGSGPEVSQVETQTEEEIFSSVGNKDVFLRSKCTSLEEDYTLLRKFNQESGWKTATTQTLHEPPPARSLRDYFLASSKEWQRGQPTKANSLIGKDFCDENSFLLKKYFACTVFALFLFFPLVFFCCLSYFVCFPLCRRSRYERRNEPLFGCTGCVNCCIKERSPSPFFAGKGYSLYLSISLYSL